MAIFFKRHLHKLLPALFLLLSLPFLSGMTERDGVFSDDCELIILWDEAISREESLRRISSLCPELVLTEHLADLSIYRSASPDRLSTQLQILNSDSSVRVAEANQTTALCNTMSELPYFDAQWALHNEGSYTYYINQLPIHRSSAEDVDINLPEAYELMADFPPKRAVTVAIIDTGVDILHPALTEHIWINEKEIPGNGIDDDHNGYVDDIYGWDFYNKDNTVCHYSYSGLGYSSANPDDNDNHGTHCAGIIASSEGVFGVASGIDIRIMPLKIHGGTKNSGSVADAIKAIKYAQAMGADICNMSWGTSVYSEALETVMRESDMLFVVAAGNSGSNNNSSPQYPASYLLDNMISVANIAQSGKLASDSNYGVSTVDIAAPGQDIYSTTVGGEYHYLSGTSMAAPVVSGVSALLYAYGESVYPQNVKEIILQTLKPLDSLTGYVRYPGIPDAAQVIRAVESLANDSTTPTLLIKTQYHEDSLLVSIQSEDLGGSGIRTLCYARGSFDADYFRNGTVGQSISGSTLTINKAGTYTFYISDYAGNEAAYVYTVQDDLVAPVLSTSCQENPDGTFTVTVTAKDTDSGVKRLRYLEGSHSEIVFLAAGEDLTGNPSCSFIAQPDATYTIYAADHRGNKTTLTVTISKLPAEQLFLNTAERTLQEGAQFRLIPLLLPFATTDYVSYTVSDETLLYAAADGTLTALAPGTVSVTVTTSGGLSKTCLIHISQNQGSTE